MCDSMKDVIGFCESCGHPLWPNDELACSTCGHLNNSDALIKEEKQNDTTEEVSNV